MATSSARRSLIACRRACPRRNRYSSSCSLGASSSRERSNVRATVSPSPVRFPLRISTAGSCSVTVRPPIRGRPDNMELQALAMASYSPPSPEEVADCARSRSSSSFARLAATLFMPRNSSKRSRSASASIPPASHPGHPSAADPEKCNHRFEPNLGAATRNACSPPTGGALSRRGAPPIDFRGFPGPAAPLEHIDSGNFTAHRWRTRQ